MMMFKPMLAKKFLSFFASSRRAHFLEMGIRILAGAGLMHFADTMRFAGFFHLFGGLLVGTSVMLMLIPWRIHHRFAKWAVPFAMEHPKLLVAGAAFQGFFILYCMTRGVYS